MTDAELNAAREFARKLREEAEPLDGDFAGYASVSIEDLDRLLALLHAANKPLQSARAFPYSPPKKGSSKRRKKPSMKTTTIIKTRTEMRVDDRDIIKNLPCVKNAIAQVPGEVKSVTIVFSTPTLDIPIDREHPLTVLIESEEIQK